MGRNFVSDAFMQLWQFGPVQAAIVMVSRVVAEIAGKHVVPFVEIVV
jgi:hypothetical protein